MISSEARVEGGWPELPFSAWRDTRDTLHMDMQIIGKLRLALCPKTNQWWNVPFYVTARGLTTSPMPYEDRTLDCTFDFIDHNLWFWTSDGQVRSLALVPRTVAAFHEEVFAILRALGFEAHIWDLPNEVAQPIPFGSDTRHRAYDPIYAHRFWVILSHLDSIFKEFRAGFRGKCSPVHVFWGSMDLAVTRFSGRVLPPRTDTDPITRDAYDEEVSSVGFWPGDDSFPRAALYAYHAPEPPGFGAQRVRPAAAFYSSPKHELLLDYDEVRRARDPRRAVLDFAESAYDAGATLAGWDRKRLEYAKVSEVEPKRPATHR